MMAPLDTAPPRDLAALLRGYHHTTLVFIARAHNLPAQGKRKEDIVAALRSFFSNERTVTAHLSTLNDPERTVFETIMLGHGVAHAESLYMKLTRAGMIAQETAKRSATWRTPLDTPMTIAPSHSRRLADIYARLVMLGLVCGHGAVQGGALDFTVPRTLVVATEIWEHVPRTSGALASLPDAALTSIVLADPRLLQRDLYLFWAALRQQPAQLTTRNLLHKRHFQRLDAALSVHDAATPQATSEDELGRSLFVRLLLEALDLIGRDDHTLVAQPRGREWFCLPWPQRARETLAHWLTSPHLEWNELLRIGRTIDRSRNRSTISTPRLRAARAMVSDIMRQQAGWVPATTIADTLEISKPDLILPHSPYSLPIARPPNEPDYPASYTSYGNEMQWEFSIWHSALGWDSVEAPTIRAMLCESLHWLGAVDIAVLKKHPVAGDPAHAVRAAQHSAWLWDEALPSPSLETNGTVIVQPNFDVLAFPPFSESTLLTLDEFAERGTIDQVAHYQITSRGVLRARQNGLEEAAILQGLHRLTHTPLPQNVARSIAQWSAQMDRVVVRHQTTILEAASAQDMDTILSLLPAPLHGSVHRRGSTIALIASDSDWTLLHDFMVGIGYPLAGNQSPGANPALAEIDHNGCLIFRDALPPLQARLDIHPLIDELTHPTPSGPFPTDHAWALTEQSVRRAVANGLTLDAIIEILSRHLATSLSSAVVHMVRRWTGFYGTLHVSTPTLLAIENEEILAALRADPEIDQLLHPYTPTHTTVRVADGELETLRAALIARGITLHPQEEEHPPR